jgi:chemotaxis protein CheD
VRHYHLKQGQCLITDGPARVVTLLGSCLSIVIYDPALSLAGISHCSLPSRRADGKGDNPFDYVDSCMEFMWSEFKRRGSSAARARVQLFGGARMLADSRRESISVGAKNVARALDLIERLGLRLEREETGGTQGRKLSFSTETGRAVCRLLVALPEGQG